MAGMRTKVLVERRPDGRLFAGNVEVQHDGRQHVKGELTVYRRGSSIVYRLADRRWRAAHSGVA